MNKMSHEDYILSLKNKRPSIEVIGTYINSKTPILHKCSCGNDNWLVAPSQVLYKPNRKCKKCSGTNKYTHEEYVDKVKSINDRFVVIDTYINSSTKIKHLCSCGNEWLVRPIDILSGHSKCCGKCKKGYADIVVGEIYTNWIVLDLAKNNKENNYSVKCKCMKCNETIQYNCAMDLINKKTTQCKSCSDRETALKNTYTHNEYLQRLNEIGSPVKVKQGQTYTKSTKKIIHICSVCGDDWAVTPQAVLSGQIMCMNCNTTKKESILATVLKQGLKHIFPNTQWEHDIGFTGPNGGVSPYDIYVPELNLLIECQSVYHDTKERQQFDNLKQEYARQIGYDFISIDNRDISPLNCLQCFIPGITQYPSYIRFDKKATLSWDIDLAQKLLNNHYTYKQIASTVGTTTRAIIHHIHKGSLIKPENYVTQNQRTWDLNEAQRLLDMKKYSYTDIARIVGNGCTESALESAVVRKLLIRPKYRKKVDQSHNRVGVVAIHTKTGELLHFNSIAETKDRDFQPASISRILSGDKKQPTHKGYLWLKSTEYDNIKESFDALRDAYKK